MSGTFHVDLEVLLPNALVSDEPSQFWRVSQAKNPEFKETLLSTLPISTEKEAPSEPT